MNIQSTVSYTPAVMFVCVFVCVFVWAVFLWCVCESVHLETFPVDDGWARFVVFLFADPHLLEGGKGSQDGTSDPYRVFPLWGSDDLDFHGWWSKVGDLLLHAVSDSGVHGGATSHDNIAVQVLPDVNIALHDGVVGGLMDTGSLHSQEGRLEDGLWTSEPFISDSDDLAIRKLVALLKGGGGGGSGHFLFKVKGDIAELLLDVTDNLALGSGGEGVATLSEDLHEVVSEVTASQVQPEDGMGQGVSFIDGDSVGNTITRVHDDTSGPTRGIQGKYGLDGNIHGGGVESFEHDLSHLLPVGFGIKGSLSQENGVLLWCNTELIVECVMPDFLHVIPVGDNTMLDGVFEGENTSL